MLTGSEIRERFLKFFEGKGHTVMPSASLVPQNDPTLLWITAGMAPFKPYFLGKDVPPNTRLTSAQKCLRTNDIENVGRTARHHTFFEMMGNFSFGDYFKAEVIPWAWEFVTKHLEFPVDKLWVSIYLDDDEAFGIWNKVVGVPADRIVRLGKDTNFWEIGVGPCGPCSEIFIDLGPERGCGSPDCGLECDCGRYLEFWNLVFIQYNKDENGVYTPLDKACVDTGMGLERTASISQGVESNFDTDLFRPVMDFTAALIGKTYGKGGRDDVALKVIADHARAVTFAVGDGVMPSNEGRGYVIRRILRRALRFGKVLGVDKPFLVDVCANVIEHFGTAYPYLPKVRDQILKVVKAEEERFQSTLNQGLSLLDGLIASVVSKGVKVLDGQEVFKLYDTYGFPLEVTKEIAEEKGLSIDEEGFEEALAEQRERARAARAETSYSDVEMEAYSGLAGIQSEFHGYETEVTSSVILAIVRNGQRVETASEGDAVDIVLDVTPFYAESGGQTGDSGSIKGPEGVFAVETTKRPFEGLSIHKGSLVSGTVAVGETVMAEIDHERRLATARNHSVTHLLHKALRETLGEHVHQAGSLVGPERLRFDFTHFSAMTMDELAKVEEKVNRMIMANLPVVTDIKSIDDARAMGAMALFGEKYGATVRLVRMGDYSLELCGGTHLRETGEAGFFKVVSEGGIAAGVRRIEAATGFGAAAFVAASEKLIDDLGGKLKASREELPERVDKLLAEIKRLEKELSSAKQESAKQQAGSLTDEAISVGDVKILITKVPPMGADEMRSYGDLLRDKLGKSVILIACENAHDKVAFLSMVSKDLTNRIQAGSIVKEAAKITGGGGGGRPDMAQAGGRDASKIPDALAAVQQMVSSALA